MSKSWALRKMPSYAREGECRVFCQACAAFDPLLINVITKQCAHCEHAAANPSYGGGSMCALCYAVTHPKAPMKRDLQTKERTLLAWLEGFVANAPSNLSMRHDQIVSGAVARSAPTSAWTPVVFLRFNPDRFVDKQGAVHQSYFALKHGVLTLAREAA
ncbi:hypothetical protein T492DRAFT_869390 [Pavlovales sp. CCMP2436]|nr:hypothetical protein T492DRAFT_869390 [Pavlovales sp. CCMP2436]